MLEVEQARTYLENHCKKYGDNLLLPIDINHHLKHQQPSDTVDIVESIMSTSDLDEQWLNTNFMARVIIPIRQLTYSNNELLENYLRVATNIDILHDYNYNKTQTIQLFDKIVHIISKAIVPYDQRVASLAAQSVGEILTQSLLNSFHQTGTENQTTSGITRWNELIRFITPKLTYLEVDTEHEYLLKYWLSHVCMIDVIESYQKLDDGSLEIVLPNTIRNDFLEKFLQTFDLIDIQMTSRHCTLRVSTNKERYQAQEYLTTYKLQGIGEDCGTRCKVFGNQIQSCTFQQLHNHVLKHSDNDFIFGIDLTKVTSNDFMDVFNFYGIDAARNTLYNEFCKNLERDGTYIDPRHVKLLSDHMTYTGEPVSNTRHSYRKHNNSIIGHAAFEEPIKSFAEGAITCRVDNLFGVSENIMLGNNIPIGSGSRNCETIFKGDVIEKKPRYEDVMKKPSAPIIPDIPDIAPPTSPFQKDQLFVEHQVENQINHLFQRTEPNQPKREPMEKQEAKKENKRSKDYFVF